MKILSPRNAVLAALAMMPLAACSSSPPLPPVVVAPAPMLPQQDAMFLNSVATANANVIAASQLAVKNGSPRIRRFATQMITDHQAVGQKLMALAQAKTVTPPMAPDDAHTQMLSSMQAVKGHTFDKGYMDGQVADHKTLVAMFQSEAQNGTDPDVKAFATENLPTLQQHLTMARRLDPKH